MIDHDEHVTERQRRYDNLISRNHDRVVCNEKRLINFMTGISFLVPPLQMPSYKQTLLLIHSLPKLAQRLGVYLLLSVSWCSL